MRSCAIAFLAPLALSCADASAPSAPADVTVAFASAGTPIAAGQPLVLEGNNGTLRVDSIFLLIADLRIEIGDACAQSRDACVQVRDAVLLSLPLAFRPEPAGTATVAGTITGVRFGVRTLRELGSDVTAAVRAVRPAWPDSAAALVTGTFRRDGDQPIPFRTWLRASVDARADVTPAQSAANGVTLIVAADPVGWFSRPKGEVLELSYFDYATTGRVLGFTSVMSEGFVDRVFVAGDR